MSGLCLEEDRATEDASGRVVALPLGFTRLASGALAYHDSFVADPDEHFWGLGERFTSFDKRGQLISCWNYDALGTQSSQSYKNVPFMLSSRGYGCFVDTTANVHFDCCHSSQAFWSVVVPDEELDYYLVFGSPKACLGQYQELVGGPDLPPAWALGTWVSTGCLPASQDDVRALADRLDAEDVPCDVLHLDAYWQTFGCWSDLRWDPERFPDPTCLLSDITSAGLRPCLWINPYLGAGSPDFAVADEAGYFLKRPDGSSYVGDLWGGYHPAVAVIDITNPGARAWWGAQLAERIAEGAAVFKTDFGEAIPVDVVAYSGLSGLRLHNAYCLLYNDFVTSVMRQAGIEHPVVWARSSWAGGQRHVGQWAGDPNSTWRDLASTLRAGLSMALSGHAFWSHDIGGFHDQPGPVGLRARGPGHRASSQQVALRPTSLPVRRRGRVRSQRGPDHAADGLRLPGASRGPGRRPAVPAGARPARRSPVPPRWAPPGVVPAGRMAALPGWPDGAGPGLPRGRPPARTRPFVGTWRERDPARRPGTAYRRRPLCPLDPGPCLSSVGHAQTDGHRLAEPRRSNDHRRARHKWCRVGQRPQRPAAARGRDRREKHRRARCLSQRVASGRHAARRSGGQCMTVREIGQPEEGIVQGTICRALIVSWSPCPLRSAWR